MITTDSHNATQSVKTLLTIVLTPILKISLCNAGIAIVLNAYAPHYVQNILALLVGSSL